MCEGKGREKRERSHVTRPKRWGAGSDDDRHDPIAGRRDGGVTVGMVFGGILAFPVGVLLVMAFGESRGFVNGLTYRNK